LRFTFAADIWEPAVCRDGLGLIGGAEDVRGSWSRGPLSLGAAGLHVGYVVARSGNPNWESNVAKKTIFVSDLSGKEIDEKDAASITIRYSDARRGQVHLDVNASEVDDLAAKGQRQARRGRKPKSAA
jgi:hypothetical protein